VFVVEKWSRRKIIGHGAIGVVWLEAGNDGDVRAVKEVSKHATRRLKIDYLKELSALANLSKARWVYSKNRKKTC
jgi:hypothetical protein